MRVLFAAAANRISVVRLLEQLLWRHLVTYLLCRPSGQWQMVPLVDAGGPKSWAQSSGCVDSVCFCALPHVWLLEALPWAAQTSHNTHLQVLKDIFEPYLGQFLKIRLTKC